MNPRTLINVALVGALGIGGYWAYKQFMAVPEALNKVGSAIGTGAADFKDFVSEAIFGPQWSMTFLAVYFAGGERHAIPTKSQEFPDGVDGKGLFTFRGKRFVIRDKKLPDGKVQHWAFNP